MTDVPEPYDEDDEIGEPEVIDIPMDDVIDTDQGTPQPVEHLDEVEILRKVMKKGSVMFSEGRMLTKCPAYSKPAICALYPMPHPKTGDTNMVCTGPTVAKEVSLKIFGPNKEYYTVKSCHRNCPYNPEKLNEDPDYEDSSSGGGWL